MRPLLRHAATLALITTTALSGTASAGGYDTPVLYSARHMGMGGTGVSWVYDPTALYINPAGIGQTEFISLTLDISPIIASIESVPKSDTPAKAGPALLTPFLFGASFRVWEYLTLGVGAFPVASASGGYEYSVAATGLDIVDETAIRFFEFPLAIAFNYKDYVSVAFSWRPTLAQIVRKQESTGKDGTVAPFHDLETSGFGMTGWRVGIQAKPIEMLSLGVHYRHRLNMDTKADSGKLLAQNLKDITFPVILPSKLTFGARVDVPIMEVDLGISLDAEYGWQSQNDKVEIAATLELPGDGPEPELKSPTLYNWQNAWTVRWGAEVGFLEGAALRMGFIWDQETSNRGYPSAFGTPPADTYSVTFGGGYKARNWEVNLAYAYRTGETTINDQDVANSDNCLNCSFPGYHAIELHGIYVDFSWYFDLPTSLAHWSPKAK
ncbi:MAG: outer membrane protein transport protein [Myxococcales bacterium]|nr:outer membrane protein transport protein [Myxococcales bacterium]